MQRGESRLGRLVCSHVHNLEAFLVRNYQGDRATDAVGTEARMIGVCYVCHARTCLHIIRFQCYAETSVQIVVVCVLHRVVL
jgi:hypothetical protein